MTQTSLWVCKDSLIGSELTPMFPFQQLVSSCDIERHFGPVSRLCHVRLASSSESARAQGYSAVSEILNVTWALQDTLRRVSAEMAQSEAQRCNPEAFHAHSKMKQKKRNWFMQLFKGGGKGGRDGQ